jgi:hypothetical protein
LGISGSTATVGITPSIYARAAGYILINQLAEEPMIQLQSSQRCY